MWKLIWLLVVFNAKTNDFEKVVIYEIKDISIESYQFYLAKSIEGGKHKNLKFIKVIKDSVYIPNDSLYSIGSEREVQFLKK